MRKVDQYLRDKAGQKWLNLEKLLVSGGMKLKVKNDLGDHQEKEQGKS